jgi:hypothetical protein
LVSFQVFAAPSLPLHSARARGVIATGQIIYLLNGSPLVATYERKPLGNVLEYVTSPNSLDTLYIPIEIAKTITATKK